MPPFQRHKSKGKTVPPHFPEILSSKTQRPVSIEEEAYFNVSRPERGGRQGGEKGLKEMSREATVREVEVEEMVHQREKQTGGQGGQVHL